MPTCPSSTEAGCRCPDHHPGLLAFTVNDQHHAELAATLERFADKTTVELPVTDAPQHDPSSYTCECPECRQEIADRMAWISSLRRAA